MNAYSWLKMTKLRKTKQELQMRHKRKKMNKKTQ